MIVREVTKGDLKEIGAWAEAQLKAWGHTGTVASADFYRKMPNDYRMFALWEDSLSAFMWAVPMKTDHGAGWDIKLFLAAEGHPDHQRVLGTLGLYAIQVAVSEGLTVISSRIMTPQAKRDDLRRFAQEELGMTLVEPDLLEGDLKPMVEFILKRHPKWQT